MKRNTAPYVLVTYVRTSVLKSNLEMEVWQTWPHRVESSLLTGCIWEACKGLARIHWDSESTLLLPLSSNGVSLTLACHFFGLHCASSCKHNKWLFSLCSDTRMEHTSLGDRCSWISSKSAWKQVKKKKKKRWPFHRYLMIFIWKYKL